MDLFSLIIYLSSLELVFSSAAYPVGPPKDTSYGGKLVHTKVTRQVKRYKRQCGGCGQSSCSGFSGFGGPLILTIPAPAPGRRRKRETGFNSVAAKLRRKRQCGCGCCNSGGGGSSFPLIITVPAPAPGRRKRASADGEYISNSIERIRQKRCGSGQPFVISVPAPATGGRDDPTPAPPVKILRPSSQFGRTVIGDRILTRVATDNVGKNNLGLRLAESRKPKLIPQRIKPFGDSDDAKVADRPTDSSEEVESWLAQASAGNPVPKFVVEDEPYEEVTGEIRKEANSEPDTMAWVESLKIPDEELIHAIESIYDELMKNLSRAESTKNPDRMEHVETPTTPKPRKSSRFSNDPSQVEAEESYGWKPLGASCDSRRECGKNAVCSSCGFYRCCSCPSIVYKRDSPNCILVQRKQSYQSGLRQPHSWPRQD